MQGVLELGRLKQLVEAGEIDTVVVAFPDMQGRLMGKRVAARFFLDSVVEETHGLRLSADGRHGNGAGARLRGGVLGARLWRLRHQAGDGDPAPDPLARGNRPGAGRPARPSQS